MPLAKPKLELDLFNEKRLLLQLQSGDLDHELHMLHGSKYPHWDVLNSYDFQKDRRPVWFECLKLMVAKGAPVAHGAMTVTGFFATFAYTQDPAELPEELVDLYHGAGLLQVNTPLPGKLSERPAADPYATAGWMPLAAAISAGNHLVVKCFLELGASLDIGSVYKGGPARHALEYARELGAESCAAVIVATQMQSALATAGAAQPESNSALRRHRLGV